VGEAKRSGSDRRPYTGLIDRKARLSFRKGWWKMTMAEFPCPRPRLALISAHTSPLATLGGRETGGMNVYVRETATELARLGHAVDVFIRDDGSMPEMQSPAPGVRVIALEAGPRALVEKEDLPQHLPGFLNALRAFREREGLRYGAVHSHYWMSGWVGRHLQRLWDVPHIAMFHTLGEVKRRARIEERESDERIETERAIIATADRIVVASAHEKGQLIRLYAAADGRVAVIPCGVNLDRFRPRDRADARATLGLPSERDIVLFVGRLEPLKGIEILIDAIAELEDSTPDLVVVGGDERASSYIAGLRAQAERAGIGDRIHFAGAVAQESLPAYYSAADVCVVPSYYESFGLVALEAMACGTPVIASRVGGLTGTIRDGESGYLIPWRCPQPFADKIDLLLTNDELRHALGVAAQERAQRFHWSAVAEELSDLYCRTIDERAAEGCHAAGAGRTATSGCHV
jgi:D-inositol-3-phosphate glycosyltransferase